MDIPMEHTTGKSFRCNLFGTISSASSSDTGRQLNFVQDGKNTLTAILVLPSDLAELKKKQKLLFDPYTRKKLEETEEELDSSNEKLAPYDMVRHVEYAQKVKLYKEEERTDRSEGRCYTWCYLQ